MVFSGVGYSRVMAGGSGDKTEANPETMLGTAGWIDKAAEDARNDVDGFMRDVRRLMERWSGSAADTHADAWSDWHGNASRLLDALEDDARALRAAAGGYLDTDGSISTAVRDADDSSYVVNI